MYTLEEINEAARARGWKFFWIWTLTFGIGLPLFLPLLMSVVGTNVKFDAANIAAYSKIILFGSIPIAVITGAIMSAVASYGTKKKMTEENSQEEQQNRENHYKRMEELLEKMSKDKE